MQRADWDNWLATIWGHSIKRNDVVRIRYSASVKGMQERVGKLLAATQESITVRVFKKPLTIHYKRLRSVEKI